MAIEKLDFGKNLRPSTVETMNKVNEVIGTVNTIDVSAINQLQKDVASLTTNLNNLTSRVSTNETNIKANSDNITTNTNDISDIKVTLYTPLSSTE